MKEVIIIDRTFCGLGLKERCFRTMITEAALGELYAQIKDHKAIYKYFAGMPSKIMLLLLYMEPGPVQKCHRIFLNADRPGEWKYRIYRAYRNIGCKSPHDYHTIQAFPFQSAEDLLLKTARAKVAASIMLGTIRANGRQDDNTDRDL